MFYLIIYFIMWLINLKSNCYRIYWSGLLGYIIKTRLYTHWKKISRSSFFILYILQHFHLFEEFVNIYCIRGYLRISKSSWTWILDILQVEMFVNCLNWCLGKMVPCKLWKNMLQEIFSISWVCKICKHFHFMNFSTYTVLCMYLTWTSFFSGAVEFKVSYKILVVLPYMPSCNLQENKMVILYNIFLLSLFWFWGLRAKKV